MDDLCQLSGAEERLEDGSAGGADEDVCADAAGAAGAGVEGAVGDADQGEDHGDLNADGEDREESAQGTMRKVGEDELINQDFSIAEGPSTGGRYRLVVNMC